MSYAPSQLQEWFKQYAADPVYLIEANRFEYMALWKEFAKEVGWKEISGGGPVPTIGMLDGRPVCVAFNVIEVHGERIVIYEATSQVVDWKMIENYLKEQWPQMFPTSSRHIKGDAGDFYYAVQMALKRKESKQAAVDVQP